MTPTTRLDGLRVLITQAGEFMGPALARVFRGLGAEQLQDALAQVDLAQGQAHGHRRGRADLDIAAGRRRGPGLPILGLGLGVDSYGEYSLFDEPAVDDRSRAAALDAGITSLMQMLAGEPVTSADGRVTTATGVQQPRVPIWIAGRAAFSAGPRRVRRHSLEGLALVDADAWTPQHVTIALHAGGLQAGEVEVALVGGAHPEPGLLEAAGTSWGNPEILPGATADDALTVAATPPR